MASEPKSSDGAARAMADSFVWDCKMLKKDRQNYSFVNAGFFCKMLVPQGFHPTGTQNEPRGGKHGTAKRISASGDFIPCR